MTELEELKAAADFARATYEAAQAAYEAAYDAADWDYGGSLSAPSNVATSADHEETPYEYTPSLAEALWAAYEDAARARDNELKKQETNT